MALETPSTERSAGAQGAFSYLETSLSSLQETADLRERSAAKRRSSPQLSTDRDAVTPLRIVIAHESPIIAAGLNATLAGLEGAGAVTLLASASVRALEHAVQRQIVFADYDTAMEVARANHLASHAGLSIACVTGRDKEVEIRAALGAGISGYVLSDCGLEDYAACLQALRSGQQYVCELALARLEESQHLRSLTPRELNVLKLVIDGQSNQAIGEELELALGTIKAHVRAILTKLGAKSRTQAASLAAERGLYGSTQAA